MENCARLKPIGASKVGKICTQITFRVSNNRFFEWFQCKNTYQFGRQEIYIYIRVGSDFQYFNY